MAAKPKTPTQERPAAASEPKRRAGRHPRHGTISSERITLRLTHDEVQRLRELGNGEVTEGVRRLLASDKMPVTPPAAPIASDTISLSAATPSPKRDLSSITAPPRPLTTSPTTSPSPVKPRPPLPRPTLAPRDAPDDLYSTVRAVPKTYSTRDAHPKSGGSASPRPYPPAATPAKDHADQGERPWWSE